MRYFIRTLVPANRPYREGFRYQVQLLDNVGQAIAAVALKGNETSAIVQPSDLIQSEYSQVVGHAVPVPILEVFREHLASGSSRKIGNYVNAAAEEISPFD